MNVCLAMFSIVKLLLWFADPLNFANFGMWGWSRALGPLFLQVELCSRVVIFILVVSGASAMSFFPP